MALAKPVFADFSEEVVVSPLEPFIAEWINHNEIPLLHEFKQQVLLQVLSINYIPIANQFSVCISDAVHFINSLFDRSLNILVNHKKVKKFDIVEVLKSGGHPARFSCDLV